jgi:hypothetical protein
MDILHQLIQSMSPSEKGYFKKYAAQGRDLDYIKLFDAIAAMDIYDEEKLVKKFRKADFIKHLSKSKNYLYNSILKALFLYHEESSPKTIIRNLLGEAEMLHNRGLLGQAGKRIEKAKALALEGEWFTSLIDALQHQKKLCDIGKIPPEELTGGEVISQVNRATEQLNNLNIYNELSTRQHQVVKSSAHLREEEVKKRLEQIQQHPSMKDVSCAQSIRAKILFYYIKFFTHIMLLDYKNARHFAGCNLELAKQNPQICQANPQIILDAYNMVLTSQHFKDNPAFVEKNLNELHSLKVNNVWLESIKFQYYYTFALSCFIESGNRGQFMLAAADATEKLCRVDYVVKEEFRLGLSVALSEGYIYFAEYDKAIAVIEEYRQNPPKQIRNDYQNYLLLFYLIAQYETGNHILVRNLVSNVGRFMKRTGEFSDIERLVLKVFACMLDKPAGKSRTAELISLSTRISQLVEEKGGRRWFNYVSIIGPFLESKIKGTKYSQFQMPEAALVE